jgi:hypothetical protein
MEDPARTLPATVEVKAVWQLGIRVLGLIIVAWI